MDSASPAPNDRATPPPRTFADKQTTRLTAALQRSSDDARTAQAGARYARRHRRLHNAPVGAPQLRGP